MLRTNKSRHKKLKSFPKQTIQLTTERQALIKNIEKNLALFGFGDHRAQLFTIELDTCSLNYFSEGLNYLVQNNCKDSNNIKILNNSETLEIDYGILKDLNETNLLNQTNFDLFFSLKDRYLIATTIHFLKKQKLLTQLNFNKLFHHQHFDELQEVINYVAMFLNSNELLPNEIFDKILLVNDLKHLSNMFDYAIRSDDFSTKNLLGLKFIKQVVNYSANITEELKKSCTDTLFSNSFENCVTSSKTICRRWFKSVSSALDECTNNSPEKLIRQKRSSNPDFTRLIPNVTFIEQTTSKLIGNSINAIESNGTSDYLINPSLNTFLLFNSLMSWVTGKKFHVGKTLNDIQIIQPNPINKLEKQMIYAIDKFGDKKTKKKFINANKLQFFKASTILNDTIKSENKNSSFYSI